MKVSLIVIGKTNRSYLKEAMEDYIKRLGRYCQFDMIEIPDIKATASWSKDAIRKAEWQKIEARLPERSQLILLDERGKSFSSMEFARRISSVQDSGLGVCFVIAGSYGAYVLLKERADLKLSLSAMTFSHQIIRPMFLEQLYRAFTIIKGEPYHNEG